jgi:hypothetical protein
MVAKMENVAKRNHITFSDITQNSLHSQMGRRNPEFERAAFHRGEKE